MPGNASNIRVWETGDVYIFDPEVPFVEATHVPADIDADLVATWLTAGLMKDDPGLDKPRDITRSDVTTWQQGVVFERFRNPKSTLNFNLLEDNEATEILVRKGKVPRPVKTYLAYEVVTDDGYKERGITKKPAIIWVPNDGKRGDPNTGRDVNCSLVPDGDDIWTIQEGIPA